MAVKKFYSNKAKAGWKENPTYVPLKKGVKQKEFEKKYFSWGYDIDLEPVKWDEFGKPIRNRDRVSGFDTRKAAEAATGRIRLGEKNKKYDLEKEKPAPLLSELFQKRLALIPERGEKVRALRVLQKVLDLLEENGYPNMRVNEFKAAHVWLYTNARKAEKTKVKDSTINRDLRTLSATINKAAEYYPQLESFIAPKIPFLKVDRSRREKVLHSVEVEAIFKNLTKPRLETESFDLYVSRYRVGLIWSLGSVTGARPGELVALKEDDILLDLNVLRITGKKTRYQTAKTIRYFPLIAIVRRILDQALEIKCSNEFIFTRKGTLTATYYDQIEKACKDAGLVYGRKNAGGIIPYDLRHTATTLLMQSGADFETVKSITGQSQATLWHYTHANQNSIDRAVSVLGDFAEKSLEFSNDGRGLDTNQEKQKLKLLVATNND